MKKCMSFITGILVLQISVFSENKTDNQNSQSYSNAYMLGVAMTRNLLEYEFSRDEINDIVKGVNDGLNKKVNPKETVKYDDVNKYINSKKEILVQKNKKEGEEYIKEALKDSKAKKFDSGLVMIIEKEGNGNIPLPTDKIKVNYKGYLINGKVFDSSYERNQPVEFVLNQVIPCWTEGLSKMKVGSKAKLICPSDIAYGDRGIEPVIPGGSTLIFEVELLDIIKDTEKNVESQAKN